MHLFISWLFVSWLALSAGARPVQLEDQDNPFVSPLGLAPGHSTLAEAAPFQNWLGFNSPDCEASCEGSPTSWKDECWGQYHFFCKAPEGSEHRGAFGMKCEGHWLVGHAKPGLAAVMCEGGFRTMSVAEATCPATGITWKKYSGSGCLGELTSWMKTTLSDALAVGWSTAAESAQELLTSLGSDKDVLQLRQWMSGTTDWQSALGNTSEKSFVAEGRCAGLSGQGRAVRKPDGSSQGQEMETMESLEDAVQNALGSSGWPANMDSTFASGPPSLLKHQSRSIFSSIMARLSQSGKVQISHGALDCKVECNGAKAWFHGLWPCWGNATLSCTSVNRAATAAAATTASAASGEHISVADSVTAPHPEGSYGGGAADSDAAAQYAGSSNAADTLPNPLVSSFIRTVTMPTIDSRAAFAAARFVRDSEVPVQHKPWEFSFSITCKGLWTGFLGKKCMGLTLEHSGAQAPNAEMERWGVCSGVHGVMTHHDSNGFCMGEMCRGKAVTHSSVTWHDDSDADMGR